MPFPIGGPERSF